MISNFLKLSAGAVIIATFCAVLTNVVFRIHHSYTTPTAVQVDGQPVPQLNGMFDKAEVVPLKVVGNQIFLDVDVNENSAADIINFIADMNADPTVSEMTIIINSPGGSTNAMFDIIAKMLDSKKPVNTYTEGMAASAAAVIFAAGKVRTVNPSTIILTHETKAMMMDVFDANKAENVKQMLDGYNKTSIDLLAQFTGKTAEWVKENLIVSGHDTITTPLEAIEIGLADKLGVL